MMSKMRTCLLLLTAPFCLLGSFAAAAAPIAFGLTNIWTIELHVTPGAWRTVTGSPTFDPADVVINGQTYKHVAVRQKGGGTTDGTAHGRPPLRLNFKEQRVAGEQKLSLNNNFFDSSYLRDV